MSLAENIYLMKQNHYILWQRLEAYRREQKLNPVLVKREASRQGSDTLLVEQDSRRSYLHSKYDPIKEARLIINGCDDIAAGTMVIFYGTGLGYHLAEFTRRHPQLDYVIYEPVPEVLEQFVTHGQLHGLPARRLKDIVLADDAQQAAGFFKDFIQRLYEKVLIIELPSHKAIFPEQYRRFQELLKHELERKRSSFHANYAFQKRWIMNSMHNFQAVLNTPNLIMEKKGAYKNQPALLVAAGPSLNEEIEHLRRIKEQGLAYIFSVGTAINTLIENDVYPHATCTYDPTEQNQRVFAKLVERNIQDIPLIFGSSVGYETIENYPGPKYHMLTDQDTMAKFFLKRADGQAIDGVRDASTIAVITLQLLHVLGFNPIILVGQNLAFKDKKRYAGGVDYDFDVTEGELADDLWVDDVQGHQILTNRGFNNMRRQMEAYLAAFTDTAVYNTTQGGAAIKGAPFVPLEDLLQGQLRESTVTPDWLPQATIKYNGDYLLAQIKVMDADYVQLDGMMIQTTALLKKINQLALDGNFEQLAKMYPRLDESMDKLANNNFFSIFIHPVNRVFHEYLSAEVADLQEEKDPRIKAAKVVRSFGRYLYRCRQDVKMMYDLYQQVITPLQND